ncbi:thioredoxin-like protein [Spinellus fusiger]|nr:thioredoxin-like protein [Spinellus fusiger]
MTIRIGDKIPQATLKYVPFNSEEDLTTCPRPVSYSLHEQLAGKTAVIFAVPGAFTPTCTEKHVPTFLSNYDALKAEGVDVILCLSSNDAFVMNAFAKAFKAGKKVTMLSTADSGFFETAELVREEPKVGCLSRPKRCALVVRDLVVTYVGVESVSGVSVSGPEDVLDHLRSGTKE